MTYMHIVKSKTMRSKYFCAYHLKNKNFAPTSEVSCAPAALKSPCLLPNIILYFVLTSPCYNVDLAVVKGITLYMLSCYLIFFSFTQHYAHMIYLYVSSFALLYSIIQAMNYLLFIYLFQC